MKGCLISQRRFVYIAHELAVLLKERHGVDEFCSYVQVRDGYDFLATQKDLPYTRLLLDEDVHKLYKKEELDLEYLREFEREYGAPNLWAYLSVDRIIRYGQLIREYPNDESPYTYEEMLRIIQVYAKHLIAFLDAEKPDFLFMFQPGALGTLLLGAIAKKRGIPVITTIIPVTTNLVSVSLRYDRLTWVEEIFRKNLTKSSGDIPGYEEAVKFIREFRNRPTVYSKVYKLLVKDGRWKQFDFLLPRNIRGSLSFVFRAFRQWWQNAEKRTDYSTIHPIHYVIDRVKRKLRNLIGVEDLYDEYDTSKPFVFYPLHYEPEIAVLLLSSFDGDQIQIIKRLARSLPVGMYVYVKEHPQMAPFRPRRFYKELKKIPNVKLIRPEIVSFDIIRHASLVAIISGSVGWEAILFGKPVITFGEVFYNALSFVGHSKTPEELPALVLKQLSGSGFTEEELARFVAALFEDGAHCDLLYLWEFEADRQRKRQELVEFAAVLARKIWLVGTHRDPVS